MKSHRGKDASRRSNPWGLSKAEARTLDAVCDHGTDKAAAVALGLSHRTVQAQMQSAYRVMGLRVGSRRTAAIRQWLEYRHARSI